MLQDRESRNINTEKEFERFKPEKYPDALVTFSKGWEVVEDIMDPVYLRQIIPVY